MKSIGNWIVLFCLIVTPLACSYAVRQSRDWAFIQSIGGISIDKPISTQDGWYLPVNCDVSGLRTITTKPTQLNSALVCYRLLLTRDGNAILLTVQTSVAGGGPETSVCRAVNIGNLKAGRYAVKYKDPDGTVHELGSVEITL